MADPHELAIEANPTTEATRTRKPKRDWHLTRIGVASLLAAAVILVAVTATFYVDSQNRVSLAKSAYVAAIKTKAEHDKAVAEEEAKAQAEQAAQEAAQAEADRIEAQKKAADEAAASQGYSPSPTADGLVFYKGVSGTCGTFMPCTHLSIYSASTCPAGVYVSANLKSASGVVVGHGNGITGGLDPSTSEIIEIDFPAVNGEPATSQVTDAHCL
ncbi:hypothetical protein ACFQ9V_05830 [Leifsonia sp. NPDC056665]|uniref:hypothetical protein n=1 Tax=Leifsonia sp. NPDC056665 TaxID=3345901 RepID=UPI0036A9207D